MKLIEIADIKVEVVKIISTPESENTEQMLKKEEDVLENKA